MQCPICRSSKISIKINSLYDDRYGYPEKFNLYTCKDCGHSFLENSFTEKELVDLYSIYYPRSEFNVDDHKPVKQEKGITAWLKGTKSGAYSWVPENVKILDVGCGYGESIAYHKMRGCEAYGVEADENVREIAKKYGYKIHIGLFKSGQYQPDFFDYITLDQVIEHNIEPTALLCEVAKILKPGGKVVISTPNIRGWGVKIFRRCWVNWHCPYHAQFFTKVSMQLAAENAGLTLQCTHSITSSEWLRYQWLHLIFYPEFKKLSLYWSGSAKPGFLKSMVSILHILKINHIITRIFDALGIGDNLLFILKRHV